MHLILKLISLLKNVCPIISSIVQSIESHYPICCLHDYIFFHNFWSIITLNLKSIKTCKLRPNNFKSRNFSCKEPCEAGAVPITNEVQKNIEVGAVSNYRSTDVLAFTEKVFLFYFKFKPTVKIWMFHKKVVSSWFPSKFRRSGILEPEIALMLTC